MRGGEAGAHFRLLDVFLRRGGFSERHLQRDPSVAEKLAAIVGATAAKPGEQSAVVTVTAKPETQHEGIVQGARTPLRSPPPAPARQPPPPSAAFVPQPRHRPPLMRPATPAWRQAPPSPQLQVSRAGSRVDGKSANSASANDASANGTQANDAPAKGNAASRPIQARHDTRKNWGSRRVPARPHTTQAPTAWGAHANVAQHSAQRRVKGRVDPSLYARSDLLLPPHYGVAIREARHNPRFSNWPQDGSAAACKLPLESQRTEKSSAEKSSAEKKSSLGDDQQMQFVSLASITEMQLGRHQHVDQRGRQSFARPVSSVHIRPAGPQARALPRPSSAPPSHFGLCPMMESEITRLVYYRL